MADFKFNKIPPFSRREEDALVFNVPGGWMEYYIPEDFFGSLSATVEGAYVKLMGSFNYRLFDKTGKSNKLMVFNLPTIFLCKPGKIEKKKDMKLDEALTASDYRVLTFYEGDQLISRLHVEQNTDNVGEILRLHIQTGKIPNSIPYDTLYTYPYKCMELNSGSYNVHSQAMGLLYAKICRDPSDVKKEFRLSKTMNKSMVGYTPISVKEAAKYISPFVAFTSENLDEALMSSVLLTDEENEGKRKHSESPLERVLTM